MQILKNSSFIFKITILKFKWIYLFNPSTSGRVNQINIFNYILNESNYVHSFK